MTVGLRISRGPILVGNEKFTDGSVARRTQIGTVAYTDTTAKTLFILPANAIPTSIDIDVQTAFNDSGTDQLSIGLGATANAFVSALDVSATGRKAPTLLKMGVSIGTAALAVTATYAGQNSNATTGALTIVVSYFVP